MDRNELKKKIYSKIDELPTLPTVLPKLLRLIEDENSSAQDIVVNISYDPALTSKILKVANSAYYGFPQGIADLDRAVALLGLNMVKSLALSLGVMHCIPSKKTSTLFSQDNLWFHSVTVAITIRELSKKLGKSDCSDYLFITGLLHDIGIVILNQFFEDLFQQTLDELDNMEEGRLHIAEQRVLGMDHGEIGAMLLERWNFPSEVKNPIAVHHQEDVPSGTNIYDVSLLRVADILSHEINQKNEESTGDDLSTIDSKDLILLELPERDLQGIRDYLNDEKDRINAFFNAIM